MVVFNLTKYDTAELFAETKLSLEKYTEISSRNNLPILWGITDKLNALTFGKDHAVKPTKRSRVKSIVLSIICILIGIILFVPSVLYPQEHIGSLIISAFSIIHGIVGLVLICSTANGKKRLNKQFEKAAVALLENTDAAVSSNKTTVIFTSSHMEISLSDTKNESAAYSNIECVIESKKTFLIVFDSRVVILQKKDIAEGNADILRGILHSSISSYHSIV